MQQAVFNPITGNKPSSKVTRSQPGHGTGVEHQACNDESFQQEDSVLKVTLSVLFNVVGGAVVLLAMFNLPVFIAVIWGL